MRSPVGLAVRFTRAHGGIGGGGDDLELLDFLRLPPGRYRVTASLEGMGAVARDVGMSIGSNPEIALRITPSVSETVTVTAATPLVDTREIGTGDGDGAVHVARRGLGEGGKSEQQKPAVNVMMKRT